MIDRVDRNDLAIGDQQFQRDAVEKLDLTRLPPITKGKTSAARYVAGLLEGAGVRLGLPLLGIGFKSVVVFKLQDRTSGALGTQLNTMV